jgi:predicted Zn-dependent peptidase
VLYSLSKYFEQLLPIVAEMLTVPVFPEKELKTFVQRNLQRLQVDLTKNDVIAYRKITEYIYGKDNPYGYNSFAPTYNDLDVEDLKAHFDKNYGTNNCIILISGKINSEISRLLNKYIGSIQNTKSIQHQHLTFKTNPAQKIKVEHPDTVQTAIRLGQRLFDRKHPDYQGVNFLNTVLGGYFGSRLMANIREEKGYTYNIYSSVDAMVFDSYFYIGTEVGNEFVEPTLKEIYKEFDLLKNELIDKEELEMVRNYMLGNLLTMLDGAFNVSEIIKTIAVEDLPRDYFQTVIKSIKEMDAKQVQILAQKYLNKEDLWEVIVGV